jgi:hypothetical protein
MLVAAMDLKAEENMVRSRGQRLGSYSDHVETMSSVQGKLLLHARFLG